MQGSRIAGLFLGGCCLLASLGGCQWQSFDQPPIAQITATPSSGPAPLLVQLSGSLSAGDSAVYEYTWEFPDQGIDPVRAIQSEQTYRQSGEYVVRLTVRDTAGQSCTDEFIIRVENTPPVASGRVSDDAPVPGQSISFDASGSYDSDGHLVDVIWDFGDGSMRHGAQVAHMYDRIGSYRVQLTIVDNAGASATLSHTMWVHEASSGGGSCGGGAIPLT